MCSLILHFPPPTSRYTGRGKRKMGEEQEEQEEEEDGDRSREGVR